MFRLVTALRGSSNECKHSTLLRSAQTRVNHLIVDVSQGNTQFVVSAEAAALATRHDVESVALQDFEAVDLAVHCLTGGASATLLANHAVEADSLTAVLNQVDKFLVTDEIADEHILSEVGNERVYFGLADGLQFAHPAESDLASEEIARLLRVQRLDIFLVASDDRNVL